MDFISRTWNYWLVPDGLNEEVHGEQFAGREDMIDRQNMGLLNKMMKSYILEH